MVRAPDEELKLSNAQITSVTVTLSHFPVGTSQEIKVISFLEFYKL